MDTANQDNYTYRQVTERLTRLFSLFPVVVVTGARQVGKSTLLRHILPDADYVTFDPSYDVEGARRDPDLFLKNHREPLVLDEIQYAPELAAAVKRAVDRDRRPGRFLLTGSQQWAVMRSLSESLAGRAVFLDLHGFEMAEWCGAASPSMSWIEDWLRAPEPETALAWISRGLPVGPYEYLYRGALPEARRLPLDGVRSFHEGYQRTYIERDVRLMADVSDGQLFGRFLRLAAALTAQEINFAHLGRDIGINPKTAAHWLAILKSSFQWFETPAFSGNTVKRVSGKAKGYIADTGIACMALAISSPSAIASHPALGALVETAAAGEVRRLCSRMSAPPALYHWRSHGGAEVDLILERDGRYHPVEIKASTRLSRNDARGIGAFRATYPGLSIAPGLVVAPVEKAWRLSETDIVIPWDAAPARGG